MLAPTKTDLEKTNPMNYNYGMLSQDQYILEREILVIIQKLGKVEKYRWMMLSIISRKFLWCILYGQNKNWIMGGSDKVLVQETKGLRSHEGNPQLSDEND